MNRFAYLYYRQPHFLPLTDTYFQQQYAMPASAVLTLSFRRTESTMHNMKES